MKKSYFTGLLVFLMFLVLFLLSDTFPRVQYSLAKDFDRRTREKIFRDTGEAETTNNFSGSEEGKVVRVQERKKLKVLSVSVVDEPAGMITPGDRVKLNFHLLVPKVADGLTIRFYSASRLVEGLEKREVELNSNAGPRISVNNSLYLGESSEKFEQLYRKEKTRLSLEESLLLVYGLREGGEVNYGTVLARPEVDGSPAEVVYPNFTKIPSNYLEKPPEGENRFYLEGDPDFTNLNDPLVRELAVGAAVHEKGYFPDEPAEIVHSVYEFVAETLEPDSWSEEEVFTSESIARWWKRGKMGPNDEYVRPHRRYVSRSTEPPGYICIEHAYLFTSLLRNLGIPAREVNLGLATHLRETEDGFELGYYCQEAAAQAYYYGKWHLFDPFLEYTSFQEYKEEFWSYVAWYAWNRRSKHGEGEKIGIDGGYGHNFMLDDSGSGIPQSRDHWKRLRSGTKPGIVVSLPEGQTGFRLRVESGEGKVAGFNNSTQEGSRIPGTLFYGSRSIPGDGNTPNKYPDIIFIPRGEVEGLKLKVVRQPGNRLLGHEERKGGSKFRLVILRKIVGKKVPTVIKKVGTLPPGESETYELKVRPNGVLNVTELD